MGGGQVWKVGMRRLHRREIIAIVRMQERLLLSAASLLSALLALGGVFPDPVRSGVGSDP